MNPGFDRKQHEGGVDKFPAAFVVAASVFVSISLNTLFSAIIFRLLGPVMQTTSESGSIYILAIMKEFRPEPVERMLYLFSIVFIPLSILAFQYLLGRNNAIRSRGGYFDSAAWWFTAVFSSLSTAVIPFGRYLDFAAPTVLLSFFLSMLAIYHFLRTGGTPSKTASALFFALSIGITLWYATRTVFDLSDIENDFTRHHLQSVLYPVVQVFQGKAQLVDFIHQYGLYAHFLEPVFRIIGLDLVRFTGVMSILNVVSYGLVATFLFGFCENKYIALLGSLAVLYFSAVISTTYRHGVSDPYFQYHPVRTLFPSILIFTGWKYLFSGGKVLYWTILLLTSTATLWNTDTGVVCFLGWFFTLTYRELATGGLRAGVKSSLQHITSSIAVLGTVVSAYFIYVRLRYSAWPDLSMLSVYQKAFFVDGHMQLPMPLLHPWIAVALLFTSGLALSIRTMLFPADEDNAKKSSIVFLLVMLGVGMFSYYQGRSHDLCLLGPMFCPAVLSAVFLDMLLSYIRNLRSFLTAMPAILIAIIITWFLSASIPGIATDIAYKGESSRGLISVLSAGDKKRSLIEDNTRFLNRSVRTGESLLILSDDNAYYYMASGTSDPTGHADITTLLLDSQFNAIVLFLSGDSYESCRLIVDRGNSSLLVINDFHLMNIIQRKYRATSKAGTLYLFNKKSCPQNDHVRLGQ